MSRFCGQPPHPRDGPARIDRKRRQSSSPVQQGRGAEAWRHCGLTTARFPADGQRTHSQIAPRPSAHRADGAEPARPRRLGLSRFLCSPRSKNGTVPLPAPVVRLALAACWRCSVVCCWPSRWAARLLASTCTTASRSGRTISGRPPRWPPTGSTATTSGMRKQEDDLSHWWSGAERSGARCPGGRRLSAKPDACATPAFRVLQARALLGISIGNFFPQTQYMCGRLSAAGAEHRRPPTAAS